MKKLLCFFLLFTLLSCDTVEEFFLYDENDPEHPILQAMALQACVDNADIFDALDLAGDFEDADQLGRIYKIEQDTADDETIYVKVVGVSATEMTLRFNSSSDTYDKELTFTSDNHNNILAELKIMACNSEYDSNFSSSGLDDNDSMTLTWEKETVNSYDEDDEDEADDYLQRTDKYTFDNDYPLFFFYYNATKTTVEKDEDDEDEETSTSIITITEVTDEDECDDDHSDYKTSCAFEDADESYDAKSCSLNVILSTYTSNKFSDEIIEVSGDSDCKLLESAE